MAGGGCRRADPRGGLRLKFSLERAVDIAHPEGAGFLLAGMERIDTPDDRTVVIELSAPDITFASRLAYSIGTIVPSDGDYTAPDDGTAGNPERFVNEDLVASGPYEVTDFRENESITLEAFDDYWGDEPANDRVLVQFFEDGAQMQAALEAGEIDIAFRDLTPQQRQDLQDSDEIDVIEGDGATIRYIVLNPFLEPMDDLATRRALAAGVDRQRIIDEVLAGGGEPLYSMVPTTFDAYVPAFREQYGQDDPEDFVDGKVNLELWYTPTHYGDTEASVAQTLQRTLEETGVFDVRLQSTEWAQYTEQAYPGESGSYPAYLLGWYPDYLDPDDYLEPFYAADAFVGVYDDPRMQRLLAEEQAASSVDAAERQRTFAQMQQLAARDTPIVPLYQQTPYAFASQGVQGVQKTMDLSQIFRYYVISKTE